MPGHARWRNVTACQVYLTLFSVTKRCIFILFCATGLFARIPAVDAYTVIVVASSSSNGGGERCGYDHQSAVAAGAIAHRGADFSDSEVKRFAFNFCRHAGGIDPKIVVASDESGFFAIAEGVRKGKGHCFGWSGPLPSPEAAAQEAIAHCKGHGEQRWPDTTWWEFPHILEQWQDYYHAGEKHT
jgi:hypothetical protein